MQNFSKVSQAMQMNTSSVSRVIAKLEDEMSATLFIRNTRKIVPTELGDQFYIKAQAILSEVENIKKSLKSHKQQKIKIHVAGDIARFFSIGILDIIKKLNQDCDFEIFFGTDLPDLIEEGIDFSICLASLKDSSLIARKIHDGELSLFRFGNRSSNLIVPRSLGAKIDELFEDENIGNIDFDQVVEVDDFARAYAISNEIGSYCIIPTFFKQILKEDPEHIAVVSDNSIMGNNFGLYLVYTYNRYKSEKGKIIISEIINFFKETLDKDKN